MQNPASQPCRQCSAWTKPGCLKCRPGFPTVGPTCRAFEYEPGSRDELFEPADDQA